jgi:hypothetical protein
MVTKEDAQHGPAPVPPDIGITNYAGNNSNKRIRWSKEKMREVVWCFMHVKATTLRENYEAAYELRRKKETDLRTNTEAKLLLNRKIYHKKQKLQTLKFMRYKQTLDIRCRII